MYLRRLILTVASLFLQTNVLTKSMASSCTEPLGMESGAIPNSAITCSHSYSSIKCSFARLNSKVAYTSYVLKGFFIQIDIGSQSHVSAVGSQVETSSHVTAFSLAFTETGVEWLNYIQNGELKLFYTSLGSDAHNFTMHSLSKTILARMVRFNVQDSRRKATLRVELYGCKYCVDRLSVDLPDSAFKASSYLDSGFYPWFGRLDKSFGNGSWCSEASDRLPYLQLYLGPDKLINEIAIQGIPQIRVNHYGVFSCSEQISPSPTTVLSSSTLNTTNTTNPVYQLDEPYEVVEMNNLNGTHCNATVRVVKSAWVSSFEILYSDNALEWTEIIEKGRLKTFLGSKESGSVINFRISDQPIEAKYIRIVPSTWKNWNCMRVELYGCNRKTSVGIGSGLIKNNAFTASSSKQGKEPWRGRLNNPLGCWCAADVTNVELVIDLEFVYRLQSFATQGNPHTSEWVTHLSVMYKERIIDDWKFYGDKVVTTVFKANGDRDGIAKNNFEPRIDASFIKFMGFSYFNSICMRVELYGDRVAMEPLGIENSAIPNHWMMSPFRYAERSRLNWPSHFTFSFASYVAFLQVKLGTDRVITGIASKGRYNAYVTKFSLLYSKERVFWSEYQEKGFVKMFSGNNDGYTKLHPIRKPFTAAYLRIQFNSVYGKSIPFAFEVYGQNASLSALGMESGEISDGQIEDFDSYSAIGMFVKDARLNLNSIWCTSNASTTSYGYPIIDLLIPTVLTGVASQGHPNESHWIKNFEVSTTTDFLGWKVVGGFAFNPYDQNAIMKSYFNKPVVARWVEINLRGFDGYPCIRLELYGSRGEVNKNVALFKPTAQSTSNTYDSSKAVDGNLTATIGAGSCSTTQEEDNPWWRVDLEHEYLIKSVSIKNNDDECCFRRLSNLKVIASVDLITNFTCATDISLKTAGEHKKIDCETMRRGRYVQISSSLRTILTLCEVEVEAYVSAELKKDPVGLETGSVKNESITASSFLGDGYLPHHGRFNTIIGSGGWCALNNNPNTEYLQVDLEVRHSVKAMYTQGLANGFLPASAQVLTYSLSYSDNSINWVHLMQGGVMKVLPKGSYFLGTEIQGRYFRFHPLTWKTHICMRVEIIGQQTCSSPIVSTLPNYAVKESSYIYSYYGWRCKLFSYGWLTNPEKDQYLVFNVVPGPKHVTRIVTTTLSSGTGVKWYSLSYSYNGIDWLAYMEHGKVKVFSGSSVSFLTVSHDLKRRVMAQLVKILVLGHTYYIGLTVELYGCKVCDDKPLGMEDGSIQDSFITASSWLDGMEPYKGRLNGETGWCSKTAISGEYMQVDLTRVMTISAITMQIVQRTVVGWPSTFKIGYSYDGRAFRNYATQDGKLKIFSSGISDRRPQSKFDLDRFVEARKVRVQVVSFSYAMCMKIELHGFKKACFEPLELSFNDAKRLMKASSYLGLGFEPWYGDMRIGDESLTWCAAETSTQQFLQFDLIFSHRITEITVSGRTADPDIPQQPNDSWVSRYKLQYGEKIGDWKYYEYSGTAVVILGNSGIKTIVSHAINTSLIARYVRILPVQWQNWICMRVEMRGCKAKERALGMENGDISKIYYDSIVSGGEDFARLGSPKTSWISECLPRVRPYLQIGLVTISKHITEIATAVASYERTWSYYISYTEEGHLWSDFTDNGLLKIFKGNHNKHLVVKHNLGRTLSARAIRLNPITWLSKPAFKVELYGDEVCNTSLGLESGLLPNSSFTSNSFSPGFEPWNARLNSPRPWCYVDKNNLGLLYIDLLNLTDVTGIASQEANNVSLGSTDEIRVFYSEDNVHWRYYGGTGNIPQNITISSGPLIDGIRMISLRTFTARYLAIQAYNYKTHPCLRIEIYGCKAKPPCPKLLGMTSGKIANESLSASSYLGPDFLPWFARLDTKIAGGGWCAARNNISEYVQVDLKDQHNLTKLILQGWGVEHVNASAWVSKFSLEYSMDGIKWTKHTENGTLEFEGNTNSGKKEIIFTKPITARFARIFTLEWHNWTCLRFELEGCNVRTVPFGFETGEYQEDNFISSNSYNESQARLNQYPGLYTEVDQAYSSAYSYLQIRIEPYGKVVTAIAIQGYDIKWVHTYLISLSNDGKHFTYYVERGHPKIFEGSKDSHHVRRQQFSPEIRSRFMRFLPRTIVVGYAVRMELYGYEVCSNPLGMQDGRIPDVSITASSFRPEYETWRVRPGTSGSWSPKTGAGSWLQVDVGKIVRLTAIAMSFDAQLAKGVTRIKLASKKFLANNWLVYGQRGNEFKEFDCSHCIVLTKIAIDGDSIIARYIKVIVVKHINHPYMKLELYGCEQVCMEDLGMETSFIKDVSITASSVLNQQSLPSRARLNTNLGYGAWCANNKDTSPYIQIDLRWSHEIRAISTQGQHSMYGDAWVQKYNISYLKGLTNETWENYMDNGIIKVFVANNDSLSVVQNVLTSPTTARLIRIHPISWSSKACLRLEVYGCEVSREDNIVPLGMTSMEIPDQNIIATSHDNSFEPWKARFPKTGWMAPQLPNQFLQIDLGSPDTEIHAIGTKHPYNKHNRVLEFFLSFSDEGSFWYQCMEYSRPKRFYNEIHPDKFGTQAVQKHFLPQPISTRYLKFEVARWQLSKNFDVSLELYGKKAPASSLLKPVGYSASSYTYSNPPRLADVNSSSAWCAEYADDRQFLQLDLGEVFYVTGVETTNVLEAVNTFTISSSLYGTVWNDYREKQVIRVFSVSLREVFVKIVTARFLRLKPKTWTKSLCMRVAAVFGKDQTAPLGISKWRIASFQMTASSQGGPGTEPWRARLNSEDLSDAWCAGEDVIGQYLLIDFLYEHHVTSVALQGRFATGSEAWVIDYWLLYSMNNIVWKYYMNGSHAKIFNGNVDPFGVVKVAIDPYIRCRFIRITPKTWHGRMCLKTELYGYQILEPIGVNNGEVPNNYILASSFEPSREPWKARLNRNDDVNSLGWEPLANDLTPYLEIRVVDQMHLMGVSTQGKHSITNPAFVTQYTLQTSLDGANWIEYVENGIKKIFTGNNDTFSVVTHILKSQITAKSVRILPVNWTNSAALRVELFGLLASIDGQYTPYSKWSACSVTCGQGFQYRKRNCSNPEPSFGGKNCTRLGSDTQTRSCNAPLCSAPTYTAPSLFKKDEPTTLVIQNCKELNLTIDFGDNNRLHTTNCFIEHTYKKSGIVEVMISATNHEVTRNAHYVEHAIRSFQDYNTTKAVLIGHQFTSNWRIDGGVILQLGFSYGDGYFQNSTLVTRDGFQTGLVMHKYDSTGVFPVELIVSNLLSTSKIKLEIIVEVAVNVSLTLTTETIFGRTYEFDDVIFQIEVLNGSNPHFVINVDDGTPVVNQTTTTLVHKYRSAALRTPNVLAYNNVSSYTAARNITINKMDLIRNATLDVHDTIFPNPTFVNLTVPRVEPFFCLINLGDGTLTNVTYLDNSTHFSHSYTVGTYTIAINCSNHLSYQLLSKTIKVQIAIQNVSLAPTTPVAITDSHTFEITADHKGTNSCYVARPGDGSTYGIGKPHCLVDYPSVTFMDMQLPFLINHIYEAVGLYMVTVNGSNAISSVNLADRAVVVQGRCNYPNTSLLNINPIKQDPTRITRVQTLIINTKIYIDCDPTSLYNVNWNISLASLTEDSKGLSYETLESLSIYKRTLDYGLHQVLFNVSMRGLVGVYEFKYGFVEVIANDLIPIILGGHFVRRGQNKSLYFDASETYDPDFITGENAFEFYWSCSNGSLPSVESIKSMSSLNRSGLPVFNKSEFCQSHRTIFQGGSKMNYTNGFMSIGDSYSVAVDVFKDVKGMVRHARFVQVMSIVDGNLPSLYLRCLRYCLALMNPNDKFSLEAFSPDLTDTASYYWRLFRATSNETSTWIEIEGLRNLTNTELSTRFVVIAPNAIAKGGKYKLQGTGWMSSGPRGVAEYIFSVNVPPYGGSCDVVIPESSANDSLFAFRCSDWIDDHLPLTYHLYYRTKLGVDLLFHHSVFPSFAIPLPLGESNHNFTLYMTMRIVDSLGAYNTTPLQTMVKRNESSNITTLLLRYLSFVDGTSCELQGLMDKGNLPDACARVIAMMSVLNNMEGDTDHLSLRIQIRTKVAEIMSKWDTKSLLEVQLLATALSESIALHEEVSVVTQRHCLDALSDMSDFTIDQSRDRSVSETTLMDTIRILIYGLSKTLSASSDSAELPYIPGLKDINIRLPNSNLTLNETSLPSDVSLEAVQISKDAIAKMDDLAKESLNRLVAGEEPFKIDVPLLTMSLQRINPNNIDKGFFTNGKASVQFPNSNTLFGPSHNMDQLGVKLVTFRRNVFTWNITWLRVKTELLLVELKDPFQRSLSVSQISQPIHFIIPRVVSTFPPPEMSFINKKRQGLTFHLFNITSLKPMNIRILPVEGHVTFGIYWKYAMRPEKSSEYFVGRLPDFSSCKLQDSSYTDCETDPHTIFIDTTRLDQLGEYFLGVETLEDYKFSEKQRVRRSPCEGSGRSKRSCLQYKTPPPTPPSNVGGLVQYNPQLHFNYTIQRFYSPCLFWDAQNNTWRGEGCKTGNLSSYHHIHCKCTHLTSFGGDLLVAPNPIDFDKVFAGFENISDNMAVLGAIIAAFSIYTILAVWLRRLDKRDAARGGITVIKSTIDSTEDHPYEVIVQTGSWSNSGTSSNVFLTIIGEEGESAGIHLTDKCKLLFSRGATDEFIVLLPKDIGKIHFVRVWHDMTGPSSSWYLNYIIVRNIKTGAQFNFVSDQWFALEKEDGVIDRILKVSAKDEMTSFKTLFRQKTEKDICDGHLWISVMAKPPKSTFTRVQRLSCCMSLLFTAMITNAMFYNIGNEPDTSSLTVGPITISIKQIIIGIQSSFIALPINIIILQIFQNARAKESRQRYPVGQDEGDGKDKSSNAKEKGLPHWTVYIAWTLCILATLVSAAFTLFYSMMWGKETSNKWISSMLVSFFQDAFVTQPLKIFLLALLIATCLKKIPQEFAEKDTKDPELDSLQVQEPSSNTFSEDMIPLASRCQPPNEDLVRRAKDYKRKELRMHGIVKENIFFALFLLALLGVSYSIRDYESYQQTSNLKGMFTYKVKDNVTFWKFVNKTVLKFSFSRQWYNARLDSAEGFTVEKNYYMVGMPRLRQVRVKKKNCTIAIARSIKPHCVGEYSIANEDTSYYLPGWKEPGNLTSDACPIPWRHQTSWELDGVPFWGHKAVYNGGGFTADLGYEMWQATDVVSTLKKHNWFDEFSRAVMVEFTIFDPQVNLFSMVTFAVEITGSGSGSSFVKVDTFKLYLHLGPSKFLLIFCEVLSILICLILTFHICKRIKNEGLKYFKNKWNVLESIQLGLCYAAVVLFIIRLVFTAKAIQKLQENPFLFVSFQYIAQWHEVNIYVIGIIVFIATMKFLRLIKFNRHIAILSRTISNSLKDVAIIGFQALLVFTAFSIVAYVFFGTKMEDFSTYILTLQSQLTMLLGKGYFSEMSQANPFLGPLYFSFFVFVMMFFLLNMFIAAITDTYAEECTGVDPDSEEFVMAGFIMDRLRSLLSTEKPTTEPWMEIKSPEYKDWPGTKQEVLYEKARQSHEMLKMKEIQLDFVMQGLVHAEKNIAKSEDSIAGKTMTVFPSHNESNKKYNKVALILLTEGYENQDEEEC